MSGTAAERIDELEIAVAHQARQIEELSDALAEQWRTIETLRAALDRLTDRFAALEQSAGQAPDNARPPHW